MAKWAFEPGHTAAEFSARHMMVTHVRGHFKDVHGTLNFEPKSPAGSSVEVVIDARKIWTGEPARDEHLRSADFLDVENFPEIRFYGNQVILIGEVDYQVTGNLTIRGVARLSSPVPGWFRLCLTCKKLEVITEAVNRIADALGKLPAN
jgi:polyisoprenoid-binding protein YceI